MTTITDDTVLGNERRTEPLRLDTAQVALQMSDGLAEWATGLLAVPMLTTVAYARAEGEAFGAVLCRVLDRACRHTLDAVVTAVPGIWDAGSEDHPDTVAAFELIEARADNLLGQAMGLAVV